MNPRTMKKWSLFAAGVFALSACGGGGAPSGEATASDFKPAGAEEKVELTIWFGRDQYQPTDKFAAFEKKYPNISVQADTIPIAQAPATFLRQYKAGDAPDVMQVFDSAVGNLALRGTLYDVAPIRKVWEKDNPNLYSALTPTAWEMSTYKGKTYGLTLHHGVMWNVYRNDILAKHGLEVPKTWDEVLEVGAKISKDEPGMSGFGLNGSRDFPPDWDISIFAQMGGQWKDSVMQIDSEAGRYWLNWYQRAAEAGVVHPDTIAYTWPNQVQNFAEGKSAMATFPTSVFIPEFEPAMKYGKNYTVSPKPIARPGAESESRYITNGWPYVVSAATKHPYEVGLLLQYLADDPQVFTVSSHYAATSNKRVMGSQDMAAVQPWQKNLLETWSKLQARPYHVNQAAMDGVIRDAMQSALKDPKADVAEMATKYQTQLDNLAAAVPSG